uniref:Uncharacterized protein n=1 Tax=Eutreptiella gymnastica TaxID=73025 RepID=A0A7S4LE95_9EUGL
MEALPPQSDTEAVVQQVRREMTDIEESYKHKLVQMEAVVGHMELRIKELEVKKTVAEQQRALPDPALERAQLQLEAVKAQAEQEKRLLEQRLLHADQRREQLEAEVAALGQQRSALEQEQVKSEAKCRRTEGAVEQHREEAEDLRMQLNNATRRMDDEVQRLRASFETERTRIHAEHTAALEAKGAKLRREVQTFQETEGSLRQRQREQEAELNTLRDQLSGYHQVMENKMQMQKDALQSETDKVRQELETLKKRLQAAVLEAESQSNRADKSEQAAAEHLASIRKFNQTIRDSEEEFARKDRQIEMHEKHIENLEDQLAAEKRASSVATGQIKDCKIEHESAINRLREVHTKDKEELRAQMQNRIKDEEENLKIKEDQIAAMREDQESMASKHEKRVQEFEERLRKAKEEKTRKDIDIARLNALVTEKAADVTSLQFAAGENKKHLDSLQSEMAAMHNMHQTKLEEVCTRNSELQREKDLKLQEKNERITTLENEARSLTDRNRILKESIQKQHEKLQHRLLEHVKTIFDDKTYYDGVST